MMAKRKQVLGRKEEMASALDGIMIVEAAGALAGPMAGRLLADWGADVIHVEHPVRGDFTRSQGLRAGGRMIKADIPYIPENQNRNK
ncbi:CoA transferase, partial [Chloroflexota bacterium]